MDAGVPIKAPVAGISCGLITEGERWMTMVDIQGLEDFFGDMDFKVAGTHEGITAIQMDLKISGLTPEMVKEALEKTHKARLYILDEVMLKAIAEPRAELSPYAPKMYTTTIPADKISEVIGKSGKVIKEIQAECEVKIDIEEDGEIGQVFVAGLDAEKCQRAIDIVQTIATDPEPGAMYLGKVTRIMDFGAFVEIAPGKEGLVHVSQLDVKRKRRRHHPRHGDRDRRQGQTQPEPPRGADQGGRSDSRGQRRRQSPASAQTQRQQRPQKKRRQKIICADSFYR